MVRGGGVTDLRLTLACGDYDLTRALIDGSVQPPGIDLTTLSMPSPERHWRMMRNEEFDVAELSMSHYLVAFANQREFTAIPVFPHRRFRHSFVFIRSDAGIAEPRDLNNKRIALRTFQNTAGVWTRGILADDYGFNIGSVQWLTQDEEETPWDPPAWLHIERVPHGANLDHLLVAGELDAAIYPETLPSFAKGDPRVARLFEHPKEVERDYFGRTGIFPIMHTVVVKNSVLREFPWVAISMLKAFRESKARCYQRLADPRQTALAWVQDLVEDQRTVLGPDPWPYDLESNRGALEALIRYSHNQGLIPEAPSVEQLFVESTFTESPRYVS
ncbi:MAG: 4,5-dihydroxyphthalate decarboxylase [Chloroflexota bacterium]|jgi:4,5-dihydroxyphthalate decarboxylase|nr:4,5-dihydroxyphthalate decarboxylase [Chloroflexota bacterium]